MSSELSGLVRAVAADYPEADPRELARHLAKETPPRQVMDFYVEALVPIVRHALIDERSAAMSNALSPRPSGRSAKLAEIRDWWAEMLAARVHVGESRWMCLGDCGVDELQFCVAERMWTVERIEAQIAQYDRLLTLLRKHKAARVRDLPKGCVK